MTSSTPVRPALVWRWSDAFLGAVYALPPAAAVMSTDVQQGPGVRGRRDPRRRPRSAPRARADGSSLVVAASWPALSIFVGAILCGEPWLAVPALFALSIGAAELAGRFAVRAACASLPALPLVAVGLSYSDLRSAGGLALIMVAGSAPTPGWSRSRGRPPASPAAPRPPSPTSMLGYGIRLGLTAATTAAVGFALDLDHVGWACAAALLVMRPSREYAAAPQPRPTRLGVPRRRRGRRHGSLTSNACRWYVLAVIAICPAAGRRHPTPAGGTSPPPSPPSW